MDKNEFAIKNQDSLVCVIWISLFIWETALYVVPSLVDKVTVVQSYIIAAAVFTTIAFCEIKRFVIRLSTLFAVYAGIVLIAGFIMRGYSNGLYMLMVLSILMVFEFRNIHWSLNYERFLAICCLIISFGMFYQTLGIVGDSWDRSSSYNRNTMACMLFLSFSIVYIAYYNYRSGLKSIVMLLYFVFVLTALIILGSRDSVVCLFLFLALSFVYKIGFLKKFKNLFYLALMIVVLGYLILFLYLSYFNVMGKGELVVFGKDLFTGREDIWLYYFFQLNTPIKILFGINTTSQYDIFNNLHSLYFSVFVRAGIVGAILFWTIFLKMFRTCLCGIDANRPNQSNRCLYAFLCICILAYGFFETAFLWNVFMPFALYPFIMLTSNYYNIGINAA